MRKGFKFDGRLQQIASTIKDDRKRLQFYEAIINLGINEQFPEVQGLGNELAKAIVILGADLQTSDARAEAGKQGGAPKENKNATKENTTKRTTAQTQLAEKKTARNQKKHDENVELIEKIKAKVESLGMVYKSGANERINCTNLRTAKAFKDTAQRFNMTTEELAFAVIDASMSDKFRSGKINNCEMIYRHYARIINESMRASNQNSIGFLPGA